jgi:hypothetical protein
MTDLVPTSALLPVDVDAARGAMTAYQEICSAVLTPDDWIGKPGQGGSFVKRSGWSKLANFYGCSVELVGETKLERNPDGDLIRAGARARATARDGRYAEGGGACGVGEDRFRTARGRQKVEHDLPSTAETRAVNRAISNLVGFGAVSAEETDGDPKTTAELPSWAHPGDIAQAARDLRIILQAAGADLSPATATEIGGKLRYGDDLGVPIAVCSALAAIAAAVARSGPAEATEASTGSTPTSEAQERLSIDEEVSS